MRFLMKAVVVGLGCVAVAGLFRLKFETDILAVLPGDVESVRALKVSQEHFDNDRQVALLLESAEEPEEGEIGELAEHLRVELAPAEVIYKSELEEDPGKFGEALAVLWRSAGRDEVGELAGVLLDEGKLAGRLEEVKEEIASSFDAERTTMAAYDPLGFLKHPAIRDLAGGGMSFQSEDGRARILLIRIPDDGMDYHAHAAWLEKIRAAIGGWEGMRAEGRGYGLTGGPVFNVEIGEGMEKDMSGTITFTSVLVAALFLMMQRSVGQLAVIAALLGLTFVITLGIGGWVFGILNLVSVGFAAILLGLVIDYGVVIAREAVGRPASGGELRKEVAPGIFWAALTTGVVFGLLSLSTFNGVRQLGGLIVIGLGVGAVVMVWLLPGFLVKFPTGEAKRWVGVPFLGRRAAGWVLGGGLMAAALVFFWKGEPEVSFDFSMVEPSSSEAAATFAKIQEKFPEWSDRNLQIIASGASWEGLRAAAEEAGKRLEDLKGEGVIETYLWPVNLIPDGRAVEGNKGELAKIAEAKERIAGELGEGGFSESGIALDRMVMEELGKGGGEIVNGLSKHFLAEGGDGKYYLSGSILAAEEIDGGNVGRLGPLNSEDFQVTGWSVVQADLLPLVKRDFRMIFLPATGVLLLGLLVVFRSVRDAGICIAVLVTSLALVNALVVAGGHSWNFLSGMAIPLIVGTGIDYGIHLVFALRRYGGDQKRVWNGVGKAICFCGISTAIGFGSLLFASNGMLRSMGMLCGGGVLLTTVLSVLVVPGLWQRRGGGKGGVR